jgi:hypothetical protein
MDIKFLQVTPDFLDQFLNNAREKVLIAKAGYRLDEVRQLISLVQNRGIFCTLYMEPGEAAVRYGYGETEAVALIKNNLSLLNVQTANQIRMAIVIVDETALVFSPLALSWEEIPSKGMEFPNGIIGEKQMADTLVRQMGGETVELPVEKEINITVTIPPIPKKNTKTIQKELTDTCSALKENPAVDPATLRKTTFYRNQYKLLKMTVHGAKIKNKTLDLRPFNKLFPNTNQRLKSSWKVLSTEDEKSLVFIKRFWTEFNQKVDTLTIHAGRHGKLIERKKISNLKDSCEQMIEKLRTGLTGETNSSSDSKQADLFSLKPQTVSLKSILDQSKQSLCDYLSSRIAEEKFDLKQLFSRERTLYKRLQETKDPVQRKQIIRQAIGTFTEDTLKFPSIETMVDAISIQYDYYDVSDELLQDSSFEQLIEKSKVNVRDYSDGYETI